MDSVTVGSSRRDQIEIFYLDSRILGIMSWGGEEEAEIRKQRT